MNYENTPCPYCGKVLREEDDVVVCPVCATPQHRECWMQNGRCANEDKHQSGYVWVKGNNTQNENKNSDESIGTEDTNSNIICHICGSENPADALHCGNCGALLGEEKSDTPKHCPFCNTENDPDARHCKNCGAPFGSSFAFQGMDYLSGTGVNGDEMIGGVKAADIALYTQNATKKFLPKFKRFAKGKKLSFNFAAFFLAPYWFFYRKIYKAGIFMIVLFATASLMLSGLMNEVVDYAEPYMTLIEEFNYETASDEETSMFEDALIKESEEFSAKAKKPMLIIAGVNLILHLICGFIGDPLYYNKMKSDLNAVNEAFRDEAMRRMMITRKGTVSILNFLASLFGYNSFVQILAAGASMIMNGF